MITPLLRTALEPVVRHRRFVRAIWWSAGAGIATVALGMAVLPWLGVHIPVVLTVIAALLAARTAGRRADRWQPDYRRFARDIEERHPDLHAVFITAVEQQPDPEAPRCSDPA